MKLKLYNVRGEEAVLAKKWADDNKWLKKLKALTGLPMPKLVL
ncbi:D-lactate dehydrogenase [Streptococcus pyogenes]|nr:D-lactate dehydrogenase [Streptococcus pyogenes]